MGRPIDVGLWDAWRRRLTRHEQWPGTVAAFCEREGVSVVAFYQWRRKLAARRAVGQADRAPRTDDAPRFVPVRIESTPPIEVELPNGARVRVTLGAGRTLADVLAAAARCDLVSSAEEGRAC